MVSVSEYQKHMAKYNESLRTKKRKKIALIKNNSVDLVVISSEELNALYKELYKAKRLTENGFTPEFEEECLRIEKEDEISGPFTPD